MTGKISPFMSSAHLALVLCALTISGCTDGDGANSGTSGATTSDGTSTSGQPSESSGTRDDESSTEEGTDPSTGGVGSSSGGTTTGASETGLTPEPLECAEIGELGSIFTVINLLTPAAEDQDTLVARLNEGLDQEIRDRDGFVSASVHRSLDNNYVVNYAQWEDAESLQATAEWIEAGNAPLVAEAFALGNPDFHPHQIVWQSSADGVRIDCNNEILTIINFLTPNEGVSASEVAAELSEAMTLEVADTPGFVSATVHESLDSPLVVNYAQWQDQRGLSQIVAELEAGESPELAEAFSLASPDFHPFELVATHFGQ